MRVIFRFSVDGESDGALRNRLANTLTRNGFVLNRNVTATFEHEDISERDLALVMQSFWKRAHDFNGDASIDHVWMYADNPPLRAV